jgi:sec-independent protein translocase protein TatA
MPFGIQPIHLLVIAAVALVIFGPRRLPAFGRWIARNLNELKKSTREMADGFKEENASARTGPGSAQGGLTGPASAPSAEGTTGPGASNESRREVPASGPAFCTSCGARLGPEMRFCPSCGTRIGAPVPNA